MAVTPPAGHLFMHTKLQWEKREEHLLNNAQHMYPTYSFTLRVEDYSYGTYAAHVSLYRRCMYSRAVSCDTGD